MSVWVGGSVAAVKPPQAVLSAKKDHAELVTILTWAYFFCLDAIVVLWRYRAEREVEANGILWWREG